MTHDELNNVIKNVKNNMHDKNNIKNIDKPIDKIKNNNLVLRNTNKILQIRAKINHYKPINLKTKSVDKNIRHKMTA